MLCRGRSGGRDLAHELIPDANVRCRTAYCRRGMAGCSRTSFSGGRVKEWDVLVFCVGYLPCLDTEQAMTMDATPLVCLYSRCMIKLLSGLRMRILLPCQRRHWPALPSPLRNYPPIVSISLRSRLHFQFAVVGRSSGHQLTPAVYENVDPQSHPTSPLRRQHHNRARQRAKRPRASFYINKASVKLARYVSSLHIPRTSTSVAPTSPRALHCNLLPAPQTQPANFACGLYLRFSLCSTPRRYTLPTLASH